MMSVGNHLRRSGADVRYRIPRALPLGLLIVSLAVSAGCGRSSQSSASSSTTPASSSVLDSDFSEEGIAELGYVVPGSAHELAYRLEAPADQNLSDITVESKCPCVKFISAPDQLQAGETSLVRIQFDAPEKYLHYTQDLYVVALAGDTPFRQPLVIDARLGLPLYATPERVQYAKNSPSTTSVNIANDGTEPVKIIYVLSDDPAVKATAPSKPLLPGQSTELQVSVSDAWEADHPARLTVKTTSEHQPEIDIWIKPARILE